MKKTLAEFCDSKKSELENSHPIKWSETKDLPRYNGVYLITDNEEKLYVGESKNIYDRVHNHHKTGNASALLEKMHDYFKQDFYKHEEKFSIYCVPCDYGRSELEEYLIEKYSPSLNNYKIKKRHRQQP